MNLYHLRYFVTLAHLEHYTKAAEELIITQPSLSHAISSLEKDLGVKLFEKEGRNIVLTKYGRLFLEEVEASLKILDAGVNNLRLTSVGQGRIDLAFLRTLGTEFIPRIMREFTDSYHLKGIDFHLYTGITPTLLNGLKERKYDLAVCSKNCQEAGIEFTPIGGQELVLIVPSDHPLADKDTIDLIETLDYPHIFFTKSSGLRPIIDNLFRKINAFPDISYEIEEDQVIAGMVAQKFGIAVVPNMHILQFLNVKTIPITSPAWERRFYVAVLKDVYQSPAVIALKNFIVEHAPNIPIIK